MNLMEVFVKIGADTSGLDSGIGDAESKVSSFASKIGSGLKTAAKVGAAAVGVASAAVSKLSKDAVENYAEYEQLVGGIETLFGDSAKKVIADADAAFKTAGMSANDYMETSIQSAAALINSLGGDQAKAADLMNMSITDMADNVNKMGTSMEAVQNAYRGFSRGNFTMLDNLALGFAGTKEGMQELLDKAKEFSGIEYDIESYSDIVEAIHVVQTEMGITGTTAKEASGTIAGSLGMLKSSWQNLVTGIADPNADLGTLIGNVVDSAGTAAENLVPVIEKSLVGIADLIDRLAPVLIEKLPGLIEQLLPTLINSAGKLIESLVQALPELIHVLIEQLPSIMQLIVDTILDLLPEIMDLGLELILALATGIADSIPQLIPALVDTIFMIVDKLTEPDTLIQLIGAALQIMLAIAQGLIQAIPRVIEKVPEIIMNLVETFIRYAPMLLGAAAELIGMLAQGLIDGLGKIVEVGANLVSGLWEGIKNAWSGLVDGVKDLAGGLVDKVKNAFGVHSPSTVFAEIGKYLDEGLAIGITRNIDTVDNAFDELGKYTDLVGGDLVSVNGVTASQSTSAGTSTAGISGTFVFPVYIGGDKVDEYVLNAQDIYNYKSGGR